MFARSAIFRRVHGGLLACNAMTVCHRTVLVERLLEKGAGGVSILPQNGYQFPSVFALCIQFRVAQREFADNNGLVNPSLHFLKLLPNLRQPYRSHPDSGVVIGEAPEALSVSPTPKGVTVTL